MGKKYGEIFLLFFFIFFVSVTFFFFFVIVLISLFSCIRSDTAAAEELQQK